MNFKKLIYFLLSILQLIHIPSNHAVESEGLGILRTLFVGTVAIISTTKAVNALKNTYYTKNKISKAKQKKHSYNTIMNYYLVAGFASMVYEKPFAYPLILFESAVFNVVRSPSIALKFLCSSTASLGKAIRSSTMQCDSHFFWGTACIGLGLGFWHYHNLYKAKAAEKEVQEKEVRKLRQENAKLILGNDTLRNKLQEFQPGWPLPQPSAPPAYNHD